MEELKITVSKPTADMLHKVEKETGDSIGEIVDRLVLNVAPKDPDVAFIVALEQYLICVSRLSKKDSTKVFGDMCGIFWGSIPPEDLEDITSNVHMKRNWEHPAIEPMTEEDLAELEAAMTKISHATKDERARQILYSFLHG